MNIVITTKKSLTMAFLLFTLLFLISSNSTAEDLEGEPVAIHLNLKESAKFSPETSGDLERVAVEEKHSSYETSSPFTRNKGEWKNMGTWESDSVNYDTKISNIMFNLWWVEDTNEEDYDAALDLQWTVYVDGTEIYQFTDENENRECDDTQGASKDEPCEYVATPNNDLSTTLTTGQKISVKVEMKAFQSIYIFYDNFTRDSGMKVESNALIFGNTGISGNTIYFEFIEGWPTDCNEAVDGNFITILIDGVELNNAEQSSGYPKVSEGSKYMLNGSEIGSERVTWIIEDEYAKLDQSVVSFSYSKKDTSTTTPILLNIADKLAVNTAGEEDDGGLLGLPGFEVTTVITALFAASFLRRKV
ncbi:MAG: hypothetical protein P8R32_01170 [Candidatus Poseidoniia archaeon]|nr:hypothetical protein [Candidatus Poseidoniia archaeon]